PFALAYFLSYLLRNVNAVVAPQLIQDLQLDAAQLGSLTAFYFLGFAAVQIPLGACLDRFGPVRVQVPLCLLAALGAAIFSFATSSWYLMAGRLLIGVGMAAGLVAGLKTVAIWFPKDRVAMMNGTFIALGTLGAVAATAPAEWVLALVDWRGLFQIFACALLLIALSFFLLVPALPESALSGGIMRRRSAMAPCSRIRSFGALPRSLPSVSEARGRCRDYGRLHGWQMLRGLIAPHS